MGWLREASAREAAKVYHPWLETPGNTRRPNVGFPAAVPTFRSAQRIQKPSDPRIKREPGGSAKPNSAHETIR